MSTPCIQSFFGITTLRNGCFIVAVLDAVISVICVSLLLAFEHKAKFSGFYVLLQIVAISIYILNDVNLIIATYMEIRWLLISWIATRVFLAFFDCIMIIYIDLKVPVKYDPSHEDSFPHPTCGFMITLVYIGILIFEITVVGSYLKLLQLYYSGNYTPSLAQQSMVMGPGPIVYPPSSTVLAYNPQASSTIMQPVAPPVVYPTPTQHGYTWLPQMFTRVPNQQYRNTTL